jgi:hypothetical protein
MLFNYFTRFQVCSGVFLLMLGFFACTRYAYRVNAQRPVDDPLKRKFHPGAIILAPLTWPLFLIVFVALSVIRAVLYGIFLILFTFALLAVRKPFLLTWLEKIATKVGNKLLEANTFLIKMVFGKPLENPQDV